MVPEPMERSSEVEVEAPGAEKLWGKLRDGFTNAGGAIKKATAKMTPPWLVPGSSLPEGPERPEAADSPGASSEVTLEADAQQSQALIYLINHAISHREALLKEDPNAGGHLSVISASDLREALLKQAADGDASAGQKWCESGDGAMPKLGVATMGALLNLASCPPDEEREEPMPETAPTAEPVTGGPRAATLTATPKAGSTLPGRTPFMPPTFEAVGSLPTAFPLGSAGDHDQISFTYSYDEEEPGLARAGSAATPLSSSVPGASACAPAPRQHTVPKASCSFAHSRFALADAYYYYESDPEETVLSQRQAAASAAAAAPAAAPNTEAVESGCAPCPPGSHASQSHVLRPHALRSLALRPCALQPCALRRLDARLARQMNTTTRRRMPRPPRPPPLMTPRSSHWKSN